MVHNCKLKPKKNIIEKYTNLLNNEGEDVVYEYLLEYGMLRYNYKIETSPDLEFLNISNRFFSLFKETGNDSAFQLGRIFRRAANSLYRKLIIINKNKKISNKFLNVV